MCTYSYELLTYTFTLLTLLNVSTIVEFNSPCGITMFYYSPRTFTTYPQGFQLSIRETLTINTWVRHYGKLDFSSWSHLFYLMCWYWIRIRWFLVHCTFYTLGYIHIYSNVPGHMGLWRNPLSHGKVIVTLVLDTCMLQIYSRIGFVGSINNPDLGYGSFSIVSSGECFHATMFLIQSLHFYFCTHMV